MSKIRKERQRAQRKERQQLRHALLMQAKDNPSETPISKNINIGISFTDYATTSTRRDIREQNIDDSRIPVLVNAIDLHKRISRNK